MKSIVHHLATFTVDGTHNPATYEAFPQRLRDRVGQLQIVLSDYTALIGGSWKLLGSPDKDTGKEITLVDKDWVVVGMNNRLYPNIPIWPNMRIRTTNSSSSPLVTASFYLME